jgi:hypothetical protein
MVCVAALRAPAALPERDADEPISYKFDRRRGVRRPAPAWLSATFADGSGRFGVAGVEVIDAGPQGFGLRTNRHFEPGMTLSLYTAGGRFPVIFASVVRCDPDADGHFAIGLSTATPRRAA